MRAKEGQWDKEMGSFWDQWGVTEDGGVPLDISLR